MLFILLILLVLSLYGVQLCDNRMEYLSKAQTTSIKGIFTIIVFLSHARGYLDLSVFQEGINRYYTDIIDGIGQLMVACFLFYSGYGIMESIRSKENYSSYFFKNRIVKTLFHFDLVLLLYVLFNTITAKVYPLKNIAFCWIGWESIGNSNWYIFDVLVLNFITWLIISISFFKERIKFIPYVMFVATIMLAVTLRLLGKEGWWYNTLFCYPAGMLLSCNKKELEKFCKSYYLLALILSAGLFGVFYYLGGSVLYNICACFFCLTITLISMKVKIGNKVLLWIGNHLFWIYIIQRLALQMISLIPVSNPFLFTICAFLLTVILSVIIERFINYIERRIII